MRLPVLLVLLPALLAARQNHQPRLAYQTYRKPNFSAAGRPNIILIITDDQDAELGSLQFMPRLARLVGEAGASYRHGYVTTPMCCPSRSSMLTGLYVHNHHVFTNNDNCSSTFWVNSHEKRTFATYLQQSGYTTAYFGKYLNKYDGNRVPPGWDEWNGLVKNSQYYNYTLNKDGVKEYHGSNHARDYLPDIITNRTLKFIEKTVKTKKLPFLAVLSYPAPHGPEAAAPQFQHLFHNVTTHHTPAYDFAPNPDKEWILRSTDKLLPLHRTFTDILGTKRLQTLQSVDWGLERVVAGLQQTGELENTFIFYTSDHGYHLGQFGLVKGKAFPYEFDTRVPFLVRGPGVLPGSVRDQPVLNIDLAPTFLDIAGLERPAHMDGRSLLGTLRHPDRKFRQSFLIERGKMTFERYAKVSQNSVLVDGNLAMLKKPRLSKQERLAVQCRKPRYQSPCRLGQKWACKEKSGLRRITRCPTKLRGGDKARKRSQNCHCLPGEKVGWKYTKLDMGEKKMQKKFLKQRLARHKFRSLNPKFLKTVPDVLSRRGRSAVEDETTGLTETVLSDMAAEEMTEVDILVEDIAEEIRNLDTARNSSSEKVECVEEDQDGVQCGVEERGRQPWLTSRTSLNQKISQLRAQLSQLKQIRKYLGSRKPRRDRRKLASSEQESCICNKARTKEQVKAAIRAEREARRGERKLLKLRRKEARRLKLERKMKRKLRKQDHCKTDIKMNCFSHDNNHWVTAPLWTGGPFCACTNSNNNTYWCVRNINSTDNYLYCEYVTGMMTYFDLSVDPHQLRNLLHTLSDVELNWMHGQVMRLRDYSAQRRFWEKKKRIDKLRDREKTRKRRQKQSRQDTEMRWRAHRKG